MSPIISGAGSGGGSTQFDYVEQTGSLTVTAVTEGTAQAFVTGASVTYSGGTRVKLQVWVGSCTYTNGTGVLVIQDNGTSIGWLIQVGDNIAVSALNVPLYAERYVTPSAGAHVYTIAAWKTAGTFILTAGAGGVGAQFPAWYRVTAA